MSFTSSLPANIPKYSVVGVIPVPKIIICGYELIYVKLGDIIDPINHRKVYDATKCVLTEVIRWGEGVEVFLK